VTVALVLSTREKLATERIKSDLSGVPVEPIYILVSVTTVPYYTRNNRKHRSSAVYQVILNLHACPGPSTGSTSGSRSILDQLPLVSCQCLLHEKLLKVSNPRRVLTIRTYLNTCHLNFYSYSTCEGRLRESTIFVALSLH
jgi:hypothetical protein